MIDERREARPTAYVLGEMTAEERALFEKELAEDAALRAEVDEVREMAALLEGEMAKDRPALAPDALARVEAEARKLTANGAAAPEGHAPAAKVVALPVKRRRGVAARAAMWLSVAALAAAVPAAFLTTSRSRLADHSPAAAAPSSWPHPAATAAPSPPAPQASVAQPSSPEPLQGGNRHDHIEENAFLRPSTDPLSTFSIDVDTASYSMVRSYLRSGSAPPPGAVRVEEMINYFGYQYAEPEGGAPLRVQLDLGVAPWAPEHRLVRVGVKGKEVKMANVDGVNIVFLVDTSGSMTDPNKLPLLKQSLRMLVDALGPNDRVALVAYAGSAGLVLPSTPIRDKQAVLSAIERLESGGSTNGGAGIQLAYKVAADGFLRGGLNRVVLATDGDFNVGTTSDDQLVKLIQEKAKTGVFLSVLGFGMGNFNDSLLEKIADKGNGQYAYIDDEREAKRVLVDGLGTMLPIAKDVKIQVEWNPAAIEAYRLIGYENRVMGAQDFNDDRKDAGEIGSGHTVTALYEVVPRGLPVPAASVDAFKYQRPAASSSSLAPSRGAIEILTVKLRYKDPDGEASKLLEQALPDRAVSLASMSPDFKFAAAVASFGMLLRGSKHAGNATFDSVFELAREGAADDPTRAELLDLMRLAKVTKR